ncbi:MAG: carbohydrate ABC transporter permease [Treponema sp.]|nr:carbohydrate ABC transporter permease [Treponema sp.]MCI6591244.1 carbohydrate ABC transporter permease [Spirochaetia bacterium]MDD7533956.1 carbohydrate ABC transporter permease [Treponema sp.]MDY3722490.1 carbohydrate ABC transporter permease [Treponema sp.]MDY5757548.1 carbohydrate ABC transporter permease [Treponema sp.]
MSTKNMYKDQTIHHYKHRRKPNRSIGGDVGIYIFLALCSIMMVFPLFFAICNALKPLDEVLKNPPTVFPRNPTFDNFSDLLITMSQGWVPLSRYIWNTIFITVVGTLGHVVLASMAAYVLAKYRFPGGQLFFRIAVVALMFSGYVTGIPNYLIMCKLHMVDTYWSLILPAIGGSLGLFLMKQFMDGFPMSLVEAAKIDGASELLIFWKLVMPNVKPAWLTISIFSIQNLWNNAQVQYIYTESKKMLRYALDQVALGGIARTGQQNAVIVFTMSVPIVFFIFSQSQIMETMATSGLKD